MVRGKKFFLESSNRIETNIDVVVEVLEFQISVIFELCLHEEFIEFCLSGLMFESPHATIFVECPPSNGGALLLAGTAVVVS